MQASSLLTDAVFACLGAGFGCGYFMALRRWIALHSAGDAVVRSVAWALVRIAAAVAFFALAAHGGALPLLASFLGFFVARSLALRAVRRPA